MIALLPLALDVGLVRSLPASQYPYGLTIGTTGDVIGKVDGSSLHISEAGPGGVSSSSFTIVDATSSVTIADDADVRMWDYVRDLPMILGFVEYTSTTPWATVGRAIDIGVYGNESLLDTTIVPKLTSNPGDVVIFGDGSPQVLSGMSDTPIVQLIGALTGLRTGAGPLLIDTLTTPVGTSGDAGGVVVPLVLDGMSVRRAIEAWLGASWDVADRNPVFLGTDLWGGLRYFAFGGGGASATSANNATSRIPTDYATLTIDNTSTSGPHATNLSWKRDLSAGAITNAVYVEPGGWVVGDTTSGRHQASTTNIGTAEESKQAAAAAVMGQRDTPAGRGSLTLENYTPTNVHPGSMLVFTDTQMGWSAHQFLITQIDKSITNVRTGTQTWTVSFFDPIETPTAGPASAMRLMGTRTRGTPV